MTTQAPAVSGTMRAAVIRQHGASDTLRIEHVATPQPAADELLIRVGAVGLNHLDVFARQGLTGPGVHPIQLPHVSGVDVAGTIASGPRAGERVLVNPAIGCGTCAQCRRGELSMCPKYTILGEHRWGGLADYVAVPTASVIPLPEDIPFELAAAVPAAYTTAWRGVVTVGHVQPGERLLVVGASGGVGCAALQIGVLAGAEVLAVAGSDSKRQRARELGAVATFDSHTDWLAALLEWTDGAGVDLVHDAVGAPTWPSSIRALGMGGRLVICGATGGDRPDFSIREVYQYHRQILGAPMGNWQDFLQVTRAVCNGQLRPEVHAIYPLERVGEAQDALEGRQHFGKIVISLA